MESRYDGARKRVRLLIAVCGVAEVSRRPEVHSRKLGFTIAVIGISDKWPQNLPDFPNQVVNDKGVITRLCLQAPKTETCLSVVLCPCKGQQ
jgi:hypothetical protein